MGLFDPAPTAIIPFVRTIDANPANGTVIAIVERGVRENGDWTAVGPKTKVASVGGQSGSIAALSANDALAIAQAAGVDVSAPGSFFEQVAAMVAKAHADQIAAAAAPPEPAPLPPEGVVDPNAPAP